MLVVGTNAPLDARQLQRVARRAVYALARVWSSYAHGSGDYAVAFSTYEVGDPTTIGDAALGPLFTATLDATEEAVLNSLFMATSVVGRDGHRAEAIPLAQVVEACVKRGVPARIPV